MNARSSVDLDVAVIGAGWAGVSVSYQLMQAGLRHAVFERHRICETWRTQRWSSFRMNTPNVLTVLPGDSYQGDEPEGYMTRDEFVAMVEGYARRHKLPVHENTGVLAVRPLAGRFSVLTTSAEYITGAVVVATGNLNIPRPNYRGACIRSTDQNIETHSRCPRARSSWLGAEIRAARLPRTWRGRAAVRTSPRVATAACREPTEVAISSFG